MVLEPELTQRQMCKAAARTPAFPQDTCLYNQAYPFTKFCLSFGWGETPKLISRKAVVLQQSSFYSLNSRLQPSATHVVSLRISISRALVQIPKSPQFNLPLLPLLQDPSTCVGWFVSPWSSVSSCPGRRWGTPETACLLSPLPPGCREHSSGNSAAKNLRVSTKPV